MNSFFFFLSELIVNRILIVSIVVNKIFHFFVYTVTLLDHEAVNVCSINERLVSLIVQ